MDNTPRARFKYLVNVWPTYLLATKPIENKD